MQKNCLTTLNNDGLIKVSGDDAANFLHNQFTNDLKQGVDEQHSQLSAYCSPKGRILALFRIYMHQGDYYLIMPRTVIEASLKRLRMFVLMSKVTLEDVSDDMGLLGLSGDSIEDALRSQLGQVPAAINGTSHHQGISIIRVPGDGPRFLLAGPKDEISQLKTQLADSSRDCSPALWEWQDIQAGLPSVQLENVEAFVPQMVNLQAVNGLSFTKGCYPGQEIVARMQYLGKLKRRMYLAHSETGELPAAGAEIVCQTPETRKVGVVVNAQPNPEGGIDLLMVNEIEATESQPVYLAGDETRALAIRPLPYSLENT